MNIYYCINQKNGGYISAQFSTSILSHFYILK